MRIHVMATRRAVKRCSGIFVSGIYSARINSRGGTPSLYIQIVVIRRSNVRSRLGIARQRTTFTGWERSAVHELGLFVVSTHYLITNVLLP